MNNIIARKITITDQFQPLSSDRVVGSVTISAPPSNTANVTLLGDTGDQVPLVPGEWHELKNVNLTDIKVKGIAGDIITAIGGTW